MSIKGFKNKQKLDGREILLLWIKLNTLNNVGVHLFNNGIKTKNNKQYYNHHLSVTVYQWIVMNIDEAWKIYSENGSPFTREQFERWCVRQAAKNNILGSSKQRFLEWIQEHGFEKYKSLYERRFPQDEFEPVVAE